MTRSVDASVPTALKRRSIGAGGVGGAFSAGERGATESAHPTNTTVSRTPTCLIFLVALGTGSTVR
jgi:hypothetical protein